MSPNNKNNTGGTRGRAALTFGDAARAGERQVLAHSFAMLVVTTALLVISAPTLWPQLFAGSASLPRVRERIAAPSPPVGEGSSQFQQRKMGEG